MVYVAHNKFDTFKTFDIYLLWSIYSVIEANIGWFNREQADSFSFPFCVNIFQSSKNPDMFSQL